MGVYFLLGALGDCIFCSPIQPALTRIPSCQQSWTCPSDQVFFDASVIWGLVGPKRIFGSPGSYEAMNWFFLGGAIGPVIVWLMHKAFPKQTWIPLINLPVLLGAIRNMPPATPLNYNVLIAVGTIFNYFLYRYRKEWWQRYNYVLLGALDAGLAFMGVLLYFSVGMAGERCELVGYRRWTLWFSSLSNRRE